MNINISKIPTPAYIVDTGAIARNLAVLDTVQKLTGCRILLALKGFAMWNLFPQIRETLQGVAASSADEARLGAEEFGKEVHATAAAFADWEMNELVKHCDTINFNTFTEWNRHKAKVRGAQRKISCGIRINPEYSEVATEIYNPCSRTSRLGTRLAAFEGNDLAGITGLHFHVMCEQNADVLQRVLVHVEEKFDKYLRRMEWVNMGGGHHISRPDYDVDLLCAEIIRFWKKYPNLKTIYLEPGEAIALNTGILAASVLDIQPGEPARAILDASAACHMPDVLEMPYRPNIVGAGNPGEKPHTYILGGATCLAGDVIGEYSFDLPLKPGDRLAFLDMAHYTMVKNNTFNGIRLPSIGIHDAVTGKIKMIREFGYQDFKGRLS
ncbi:MAG: carboxynorspermidine decarboxylase [Fibrobacterota bacterium]